MIKQKKLAELKAHLAGREITLLTGPRQAGKTTLLKFLETELKNSGKRTLFLNDDSDCNTDADSDFWGGRDLIQVWMRGSLR